MNQSLENDIGEAWGKIGDRFKRVGPALSSASLVRAWSESVQKLRDTFATYVSPAGAERFQIPEDYATFMQSIGGGWDYEKGWEHLFDAHEVARTTGIDCENCAEYRCEDDGLWLDVGVCGSKHDFLICCEHGHPLFGAIVEAEDAHPWNGGYHAMWMLSPTFLGFLQNYLPGRTSYPIRWSKMPVSVSDWLKGGDRPTHPE